MKLTRRLLREHGIFNSHDVCRRGGGEVYVAYYPKRPRFWCPPTWRVIKMDGSRLQMFHIDGDARAGSPANKAALTEACLWAAKEYGVRHWERDVYGSWQDKAVMTQLRRLMKGQ